MIFSLHVAGLSSLVGSLNFIVTFMRYFLFSFFSLFGISFFRFTSLLAQLNSSGSLNRSQQLLAFISKRRFKQLRCFDSLFVYNCLASHKINKSKALIAYQAEAFFYNSAHSRSNLR
jgi:hypothetical protein